MKLHYYSSRSDSSVAKEFVNFGDDLNAVLWERLFPHMLDNDESTIFSGIGSHLNLQFANRFLGRRHIVFGTGYGYGEPLRATPGDWKVYFVRGPLTAQSMGLCSSAVLTDAAVLVRLVYRTNVRRDIPVSVMPHVATIEAAGATWLKVCEGLGFHLIDVRASLDTVLSELSRSQLVITEALHGAIVADALRTPWIPFTSHPTISELKWRDWCESIGVTYAPHKVMPLWSAARPAHILSRVKQSFKTSMLRRTLTGLVKRSRPQLSSDTKIGELTERLRLEADRLASDVGVKLAA